VRIEAVDKACEIKKRIIVLKKKEKALVEVERMGIAFVTMHGYFQHTTPLHVFKETHPVIDVVKTMLSKELQLEIAALTEELEDL
jgi:hypothetical protein